MPWRELVQRTYRETQEDDGLGLAAQLAYYFFLALFPTLLFLLALASFFPIARFTDTLPELLGRFAAPEMVALIRDQLTQISNGNHGGLLSLGLLGALWSSSAALVSIIGVLNRAYDIEEARPFWKVRLIAIGLTIGLGIFVLTSLAIVMAGPMIIDHLARIGGMGAVFTWTWQILQWPIAFALMCLGIGVVYYVAPDAEQDWVWVTPGALLATALWFLGSLMFRLYVVSFGNYQATYGALGGVVVLLLWMYLTGFVIVLGAEVNAEIEHASPWGKAPGEKVPGERKQIGALAGRTFRERGMKNPAPRPEPLVSPSSAANLAPEQPGIGEWAAAFALKLIWPRLRRRHVSH
jgi:membrane protein